MKDIVYLILKQNFVHIFDKTPSCCQNRYRKCIQLNNHYLISINMHQKQSLQFFREKIPNICFRLFNFPLGAGRLKPGPLTVLSEFAK